MANVYGDRLTSRFSAMKYAVKQWAETKASGPVFFVGPCLHHVRYLLKIGATKYESSERVNEIEREHNFTNND